MFVISVGLFVFVVCFVIGGSFVRSFVRSFFHSFCLIVLFSVIRNLTCSCSLFLCSVLIHTCLMFLFFVCFLGCVYVFVGFLSGYSLSVFLHQLFIAHMFSFVV